MSVCPSRSARVLSTGARQAGKPAALLRSTAMAAALLLAGCASVELKPLEVSVIKGQAQADRSAAQRGVEPVSGPIGLEEAIARALKYNLDRRARMMEEAIALNQLEVGRYDMLPKLVAAAGYSHNDQESTRRATDSVTGDPSLAHPFISSEKGHTVTDLGLTWNLLDFGLSYYGAQQNADRALIAVERRRKAMHLLIQDVRTAFWRTASAQKLRDEVRKTILAGEDALKDARKAEDERIRSPVESLRFQRQVLENLRLLEAIDQELSTASVELANLINVPLAAGLRVEEPAETLSLRMLDLPVEAMEEVAIARNAELREQFYNGRVAAAETRKVILRLFPNLNLNFNAKRDNDQYLVHNSWNEVGARLSFGLLNLLAAPSQVRLADAGVALADQRRVATLMAIVAQVHVARLQYANAVQQYQRSDAIWMVDDRLNRHVTNREQAQTQSKLDQVANNTAAILSRLRRYQSLAQAHAAASRLQASLGMEPDIGSVQDLSLAELQAAIGSAIKQWESGALPEEKPQAGAASSASPSGTVSPAVAEAPAAVSTAAPAASSEATEPAVALPVSTPSIEAGPEPVAASAGGWVVRLGTFRKAVAAERIAGKTRALDLPVFTQERQRGATQRTLVRAGPFATREAAEAARDKLAGVRLDGHVKSL